MACAARAQMQKSRLAMHSSMQDSADRLTAFWAATEKSGAYLLDAVRHSCWLVRDLSLVSLLLRLLYFVLFSMVVIRLAAFPPGARAFLY